MITIVEYTLDVRTPDDPPIPMINPHMEMARPYLLPEKFQQKLELQK